MFNEILSAMLDALTFDLLDEVQFLLDFIELPSVHSLLSDDEYHLLRTFEVDLIFLKSYQTTVYIIKIK